MTDDRTARPLSLRRRPGQCHGHRSRPARGDRKVALIGIDGLRWTEIRAGLVDKRHRPDLVGIVVVDWALLGHLGIAPDPA
jgi:hypothetical protein